MPKRKATTRKKNLAEADSNGGDATDSAVAVASREPVPPPTKKTKVTEKVTGKTNS